MYNNHILNESGCINMYLIINVTQRASTESVLCLPRRYRTPKLGDIYMCLRVSLTI